MFALSHQVATVESSTAKRRLRIAPVAMRVAILVLANLTPRALFATAAHFAPSEVDIYVHLDAKTDLTDYLAQTGPYPPRVRFLEARRRVYWGGFSMVEATLDLLREAVRAGPYQRYVFISDDSLPVQSLDGFFATLAGVEDMIVCKAPHPHQQEYYDEFYLTDADLFDYRRRGLAARPVDVATQDQLVRFLALKARGKKPVKIFRGQASWALSHDSAMLVLNAAENDPWWMESCRFAFGADEFFFHAIVGAAKYRNGRNDPPTYTDELRFVGRVFRHARDLPFDMQPHFLFLRKIAPDFAPELPETCVRLYAGVRQMLAQDPAVRSQCAIAVSDGGVPHLHLLAPIADDPAWGSSENRWGRRFRRLNADAAVWRLRAPASWPQVRLSLTCVIDPDDSILPDAVFEIDGQRAPLTACDVGYRAEFAGLAAPFDTITLRLRPGAFSRLAVAVMPAA